ncbi:MAG: DUF4835 family protein [Flavobacteriales bacterium]
MRILFLLIFLSLCRFVSAQELNCKVEIIHAQVQGVDPALFQKLKKDISDFMNNRKWTSDAFSLEEKIECNLFITVNSAPATDQFMASVVVQSFRPIYGATYKSQLMDINDNDFNFAYTPSQTMDYSDNEFISNLTAMLAYYAYVIIGFDYDTYALKGGSDYFSKAQNIINNAQSAAASGWKANDGTRNRYWLIENLMNEVYEPLRICNYKYHRLGLDIMAKETVKGRETITESLKLLDALVRRKPNSYSVKVFFDAKYQEIINIYKDDSVADKQAMVDYLTKIDPGNGNRYNKILQK